MLPNRKIVGEVLHNYGNIRQLDLGVAVAYDTPLEAALAVVNKVVAANPHVLEDPVAVIGVAALRDSSVGISIRPWVQVGDFGPAGAEIHQALVTELRDADIEIPFPQREVRLLENDWHEAAASDATRRRAGATRRVGPAIRPARGAIS